MVSGRGAQVLNQAVVVVVVPPMSSGVEAQ